MQASKRKRRSVSETGNSALVWVGVACLFGATSAAADEFNPPRPNAVAPVNYIEWLNETVSKGVTVNAYDAYLEAFEKIEAFPAEWTNNNPAIPAWLSANQEGLVLFRDATKMPEFAFRWEPPGGAGDERVDYLIGSVQVHWLAAWRDAANGLIAIGWRASKVGRIDVLTENVLAVLRASRHLYRSLLLFGRLRASADATIAYDTLAMALQSGDGGALAEQLAPRLTKDDPPIPGFRRQIMMERLSTWDFAQRLYVPGEVPGELEIHHPILQWFVDKGARPYSPLMQLAQKKIGFDKTISEFNAYFDGMTDWFDVPYHKVQPVDREQTARDAFDHVRVNTRNPLAMMVMVPLVHPRKIDEQLRATRRATHLLVHLFDHKRQHGSFPKTLDKLKIDNLAQLRVDPFSGRDLVYRLTERGFTLYSLSHDLKDDGGKRASWEEEGDKVFWPLPQ